MMDTVHLRSVIEIVKTTKEIKKILDSLAITVDKLRKSDWTDRKKDLKTFNGPLWSPTRRKVAKLRRQFDGGMHTLSYMVIAVERNQESITGHFKKLIEEAEKNQRNISVYYGNILKQLSRSKESDIYAALMDKRREKPQEKLKALYEEIISLRKIIDKLHNHASKAKEE